MDERVDERGREHSIFEVRFRGWLGLLQFLVVLVAIVAFAFLLWEPHLEGRNVNATVVQIYFRDPFLAYAYVSSVPFFLALQQVMRILEQARCGALVSPAVLQALVCIKQCAGATVVLVLLGVLWIVLWSGCDEYPPPLALGGALALAAAVAAGLARAGERCLLQGLAQAGQVEVSVDNPAEEMGSCHSVEPF